MGGTSCDVSVATDGRVAVTGGREVGGRALALPMVDVHTVGAGGGSIAWRDAGGALRVGPRSAGADPGPACYGRGGDEPTVTDANLLLGYLDAGSPLAGGVELDREAAEKAVGGLGEELGLSLEETAAGIVRVAGAEMAQAVRVVTVERGIDPRELGAGGLRRRRPAARRRDRRGARDDADRGAERVGRALGARAGGLRAPPRPGGERAAGRRRADPPRPWPRWWSAWASAGARSWASPTPSCAPPTTCATPARPSSCRSRASSSPSPTSCARGFDRAHAERYGYDDPDAELELVTVRVAAALPGAEHPADRAARRRAPRHRASCASATKRWKRRCSARAPSRDGPAIFELPGATLVVPPGWSAKAGGDAVVMERA